MGAMVKDGMDADALLGLCVGVMVWDGTEYRCEYGEDTAFDADEVVARIQAVCGRDRASQRSRQGVSLLVIRQSYDT